jgi:DNA mismatch repair protein MutL
VRFRRPREVRDAVIAAIRGAMETPAGPDDNGVPPDRAAPERAGAATQLQIVDLPPSRTFRYPRRPMREIAAADSLPSPGPFEDSRVALTEENHMPGESGQSAAARDASVGAAPAPWSWCRVLGQIGGLYVVLETEDGYVLMDPHAGHERVLFEKFMRDVAGRSVPSQSLLLPQTVELAPRDAQRVRKSLELLRSMGFGISEFGGDAFVVDAMPAYFSGANAGPILTELSAAEEEGGRSASRERWRADAVARAACRAAVKARDKLTLEEIEHLVVELARAEMPYTCPHGRPTLIYTSFRELERKFGRE